MGEGGRAQGVSSHILSWSFPLLLLIPITPASHPFVDDPALPPLLWYGKVSGGDGGGGGGGSIFLLTVVYHNFTGNLALETVAYKQITIKV